MKMGKLPQKVIFFINPSQPCICFDPNISSSFQVDFFISLCFFADHKWATGLSWNNNQNIVSALILICYQLKRNIRIKKRTKSIQHILVFLNTALRHTFLRNMRNRFNPVVVFFFDSDEQELHIIIIVVIPICAECFQDPILLMCGCFIFNIGAFGRSHAQNLVRLLLNSFIIHTLTSSKQTYDTAIQSLCQSKQIFTVLLFTLSL